MKLKDFRIGWRTLVQEPFYSLVVIGGLGIGVATALLLLGFVRFSTQYNQHVPGVENVYVVKQRQNIDPKAPWYDQAPLLLRAAAAKAPGVVDATGYIPTRAETQGLTVRIDGELRKMRSLTVMPSFSTMLGLQAVQGDLKAALDQPDSFAITEAAAQRLFGTTNALGRTMLVEGKLLRAGAIVQTPPANTTIPFEALVGLNSVLAMPELKDEMLTGKAGWWGKILVRVHPDASLAAISASLQQAVDNTPKLNEHPPEVKQRLAGRKALDVALAPLDKAYFDNDITSNYIVHAGERGNPVVVAGLATIAALILALAAVNYVNLAAVRVLRRQREVAMRKVLGAGVRQIVLQLLAESMLVALIATALGLLLTWMALPLFSELINRKLDGLFAPANIGAALALGGMLGLITGAYPAWIAARVHPSQALAGRADSESRRGMQMRRVMTVVQIATAMGLASVAAAVAWQTDFAMQASPGFDAAKILIVDLPEPVKESPAAQGYIAALGAEAAVAGIAISEEAVGRKDVTWSRDLKRPNGAGATMEFKSVSARFFELYGIKPVAGRLFSARVDKEDDPEPLILNAIAAHELGFANPADALGQTLLFTGFDNVVTPKRVVGIAPELRFQTLREAPHAMAYELWTAGAALSVKGNGTLTELDSLVRRIWPKYFPEALPKTRPAAEILAQNYADDARMAKLLGMATAIALAIAAFGTYVMSAHTVQRRSREIVLRKLHGAGKADIGLLVVREIGGLTLVAALLGLPLAALATERYLAGFVEHAPIGYWTLLLALAATVSIALMAVARHTLIAIRIKPADALRM